MTRLILCASLAGLTVLVGIVTAIVQSHNRDLGMRLADLRDETTLIEAVNGAATARVIGKDHGPLESLECKVQKKVSR